MVLGGQTLLGQSPLGSAANPIATAVPGGVVPIPGAAPVQARFGAPKPADLSRAPITKAADSGSSAIYDQLARERFERYAQAHARSTANLQPNVVVPFARVPENAASQ
jgi:hypothetical protein